MSNNISPGANLAMLGLSVALVFGIHACERYESPAMRAGKPDAIAAARARSRKRGPEGSDADATENYDTRYQVALSRVKTEALQELENRDITILLDSRLAHQQTGFFDDAALAVYYPNEKVVCLYDNGHDTTSFWSEDAGDHSTDMLEKLAYGLRDGGISSTEPAFAALYSRRVGKATVTYVRWDSASDFSRGMQNKNADISTAPPPPARQLEMVH